MLTALVILGFALTSPAIVKEFWALKRDVQQLRVDIYVVAAGLAFLYPASWLLIGIPRGEQPREQLWPSIVVFAIMIFMALRANKIYKDMLYGTTPASS